MIPRLGGVSAPWTTYDSYSRNAFGRLGNEGLERSSRTDGRGPQDGSDTAQNVMERASIRHSTTPERSPRSCSQKAVREHDFLHWIGSDWDTAASSPTYSSPSPSSSSSLRLPSPWSTPRGLLGFILDPWDLQSWGLLGYISSSGSLAGDFSICRLLRTLGGLLQASWSPLEACRGPLGRLLGSPLLSRR